ncbi:MAG: peroxidase family protein [Myxococcota bacterium]
MAPHTTLVSLNTTPNAQLAPQCPYFAAKAKNDGPAIREMSKEFINSNEPAKLALAEVALKETAQSGDSSAETLHLLGLAQFMQGKYSDAKATLQAAAKADPKNTDIQKLLGRASRNVTTKIDVAPLPTDKFDVSQLTAPPALFLREPQNIAPLPKGSFLGTVVGKLRDLGGAVATPILGAVMTLAGKNGVEETWKEWPALQNKGKLGPLQADIKIGSIREWMNKNTLKSTEAPGQLVNNQLPGQKRPEWTNRFRTATGAWTTDDPSEGSAGARVAWQGKSPMMEVRRDRSLDDDLPSVRELSRAFLVSNGEQKKAPFLNNLTIAWIQFMLHDWINHRQADLSDNQAIKIELAADDPLRKRYGQDAMYFRRTQPDPIETKGMQTYRNEVTAWWDGSQIYGSDQATQDKLRQDKNGKTLADGKMRLDDGNLPIDEKGRELSGFTRNWWTGLSMFHTLFVKHHNYICDELKAKHPNWSTDQLFNTARLINAATMAKIHTVEWTPAVLPTKTLATGMNTNWNGMVETLTKSFKDRKALGTFDLTNPVLGGLVGGKRDGLGVPYNFGEQFPEVYRLHAGFLQDLIIRQIGQNSPVASIPADETREQGSQKVSHKFGMDTVINSLGNEKMALLTHNNYPEFFSEMSVEGSPVTDLGAADLLRARERGVPPYNEFRRQIGLPEIEKFEDLKADPETTAKLKKMYGEGKEGVEKMDLLVGTLCEGDRPLMGFGQTLFAVFVQFASGRLMRDPWFGKEKYNEKYYTKEGLDLIDKANLKDIMELHYPKLKDSGLEGVNNAFEPWTSTVKDHPEEHPLSAGAEKY